jgi:hypothetical protein
MNKYTELLNECLAESNDDTSIILEAKKKVEKVDAELDIYDVTDKIEKGMPKGFDNLRIGLGNNGDVIAELYNHDSIFTEKQITSASALFTKLITKLGNETKLKLSSKGNVEVYKSGDNGEDLVVGVTLKGDTKKFKGMFELSTPW